ncbi:hypothetical protein C8F04DRAFT_1076520 [Mycena alexandri]|uniref:Uncharacterized protein n=1 Tax=Mycena alexandri TaxID=1745969 RepID=A0AAD6TAQ3_9AGAR|nr:hypothetical protein C8F04DRAFT_1076520 [Mycena alexandri]
MLAPPLGGRNTPRPFLRSLNASRPHVSTVSTPPTTPRRRLHSAPPTVTPQKRPWLALTPPEDADTSNPLSILEFYVCDKIAPYLEEDRGLTSIIENIGQDSRFQVPASPGVYTNSLFRTVANDCLRAASINALAPCIFAPTTCQVLSSYYAGLHGCDTECEPQCGGFGDVIISEIFLNFFYNLVDLCGVLAKLARAAGEAEGSQSGEPPSADDENGNGSGGDDGKGEAGGGGRAGGGRGGGAGAGGSGGAGEGGSGGEGGGSGGGANEEAQAEGSLFQTLPLIEIVVPSRTTPPRPPKPWKSARRAAAPMDTPAPALATNSLEIRRNCCRDQAFQLATTAFPHTPPLIHPLLPSLLDPSTPSKPPVTLFHATRLSTLSHFRRYGVDPFRYAHGNFFSPAPSFNLADTIEAAMSHVLHGMPTTWHPITGAPTNPILIFEFEVDLTGRKIHNLMRWDNHPLELADPALSEWVKANWEKQGKGEMPTDMDFVIGPFLVPINQHSKHIVMDAWSRTNQLPIHVAAVSQPAFTLLNNSLKAIYVEREDRLPG